MTRPPPTGADFGPDAEDPRFLSEQLVTYLGNKRSLLGFIAPVFETIRAETGRDRLRGADLFSGSGVVARLMKRFCSELIVNDLEPYAAVLNRCYLANRSAIDIPRLRDTYRSISSRLSSSALADGFISELYAPADDSRIQPGERAFYTRRNARYLDTARRLIAEMPEADQPFYLAPLLYEASVHANTSGVFKGFYKDAASGVGRFGGTAENALSRIMADIELPFPVWSHYDSRVTVLASDAGDAARALPPLDLVYLDPPYNQHPYGSNYFMLNLLTSYRRPEAASEVSGIPVDWNRSVYNRRSSALGALESLVRSLDASHVVISFNSEGFITLDQMSTMLSSAGRVEVLQTAYNTFRGSRNLRNRDAHVTEYLYVLRK